MYTENVGRTWPASEPQPVSSGLSWRRVVDSAMRGKSPVLGRQGSIELLMTGSVKDCPTGRSSWTLLYISPSGHPDCMSNSLVTHRMVLKVVQSQNSHEKQ